MTETTDTTPRDSKRLPRRSPNPFWSFLVVLYRLLLLGVGGSIAWFAGIAIATFFPGNVQEPPLLERLFLETEKVIDGTRQIADPVPVSPTNSTEPTEGATSASRTQLQQELEQIQAEMNQLSDRASDLEAQLGTDSGAGASSTTNPQNGLAITLPSDVLFDADQRTLRVASKPVLQALVEDLKQYPGAGIRIVGHTDRTTDTADSSALSFAQAQAIANYLTPALGDSYQITVLGQGNRQPAVQEGTGGQQRNRRIEILIDPQS